MAGAGSGDPRTTWTLAQHGPSHNIVAVVRFHTRQGHLPQSPSLPESSGDSHPLLAWNPRCSASGLQLGEIGVSTLPGFDKLSFRDRNRTNRGNPEFRLWSF